jgi:hypothetical protein
MPISRTLLVEIVQALNQTDDGSPLELAYCCIVIPPDTPAAHSFGPFEDAEEERAIIQQCKLDSFGYLDGIEIILCLLSRVARSVPW